MVSTIDYMFFSGFITQKYPCNILQFFTAVKTIILDEKMRYFSYFCSKHKLRVHVRILRRF